MAHQETMASETSISLHTLACDATKLAGTYALRQVREDGHWYGEMKSNATITAEYVFLAQALGFSIEEDRDDLIKYFLSEQNTDGSWSLAYDFPGDVSVTAEAYFALCLLGLDRSHPAMASAREFTLSKGGIAKVRVFTRMFFACFGLFPWSAVPELPAELILLPAAAPMSIYRLASWARATVVPMLVIRHHRPIYALPNGRSSSNEYLDELWVDPTDKMVPYSPSLWSLWNDDLTAFGFTLADNILKALGGLRWFPSRKIALRHCVAWILERQEPEGDIGGIFPPLHAALFALALEGYGLESSPVRRGIDALQNTYAWRDSTGLRIQGCISPIWDTILMTIGLIDSSLPAESPLVARSSRYLKAHQQLGNEGDWRVYNGNVPSGGFSFEYFNSWYPDIDDTAAAILAMVKQDPNLLDLGPILSAVQWILGLQNDDGGWAAFDRENNYLFLNKIPFSDMDSFCDPSTADVTGRVIECFGLLAKRGSVLSRNGKNPIPRFFIDDMSSATERAIDFLSTEQEADGSWYGRWGSNYIYGTSAVLCGLVYHLEGWDDTYPVMEKRHKVDTHAAMDWLKRHQNPDGGWGERASNPIMNLVSQATGHPQHRRRPGH